MSSRSSRHRRPDDVEVERQVRARNTDGIDDNLENQESNPISVDDDEDNDDSTVYKCTSDDFNVSSIPSSIKLSEKDSSNWQNLNADVKKACLKVVVRFIVLRSGKKESITREKIAEVLGTLDASYKRQCAACIFHANEILKNDFGLRLSVENEIMCTESGKANYVVVNEMNSPQLFRILSCANHGKAFTGFCNVVMNIIFTSPNRESTIEDVLKQLRCLDSRFPSALDEKKNRPVGPAGNFAIPELGNDVTGLLNKMKKEGYIDMVKSDIEGGTKSVYKLGPRFFTEIGNLRLVISYYQSIGEPISSHVIEDIKKENQRIVDERNIRNGGTVSQDQ